MEEVRRTIENAIHPTNYLALAQVDEAKIWGYKLSSLSRTHIRKMLSRYWNNISPFALDLAGAVHRQSIFTDKMHQVCGTKLLASVVAMIAAHDDQIDWIHSPSATETMSRLIVKFDRFIQIMAINPHHIAVPTLDVDLAWVSLMTIDDLSARFSKYW